MTSGPIDAFMLLSFGGPEGPAEVMPFLRNVVAGKGVPDSRLAEVAEHYYHFGGVSPINAQNRELLAAIEKEFSAREIDIPIYWGNRNWHPMLADTVRKMRDDGVRHAVAFATAGYSSYSACRQYLSDIAGARAMVESAPAITKIGPYFDQPGFVNSHRHGLRGARTELGATDPANTRLVFCAHSIPTAMNARSGVNGGAYEAQLRQTAAAVASAVAPELAWDLVWQSRSGSPHVPWLAPDINDHLRTLAAAGIKNVVVSPIGFVSDHLEVKWDLDNEAAQTARSLGMRLVRAATPGTHPDFVAMIVDLVQRALAGDVLPVCGPECCAPR